MDIQRLNELMAQYNFVLVFGIINEVLKRLVAASYHVHQIARNLILNNSKETNAWVLLLNTFQLKAY